MKVLVIIGLLVACANASVFSKVPEKLFLSFATGYIIQGEDAAPHAAPYIVSLSKKAKPHNHICGGTLISNDWILTAAHCISNPVGMGAVAGLHERSRLDDRTQSRVVDFGKIHENYDGGVGPYDIAILHVSQSYKTDAYVQPAALPRREEIHSGTTHLYGWGQPKPFQFTPATTLQTVETQIVEWNQCKQILPNNAPLHPSNICSDSLGKGISACNGDSGGPLVIEHGGRPAELVGIVSWGYIPCGVANNPSVYTRVSAYIDWINKVEHAFYSLY